MNNKSYTELPRHSFSEAFDNFMSNIKNFEGRSRRSDFWPVFLAAEVLSIIISILGSNLGEGNTGIAIILLVVGLAISLSLLSLKVRRLHDVGMSGKWVIADIVTSFLYNLGIGSLLIITARLIVFIVMVVCFFGDSVKERNEYGPSPKYVLKEDDSVSSL